MTSPEFPRKPVGWSFRESTIVERKFHGEGALPTGVSIEKTELSRGTDDRLDLPERELDNDLEFTKVALDKPYSDIPGTVVFDSDMARRGFHANQFCMSLMKQENRERFLADEPAYLDEWPTSEAQKQAFLDRDYNRLLELGVNIYFFSKLFFTDEISFEKGAAMMTGMSQQDYRAMMLAGGRSPEGNRYSGASDDG